MLKNRIIVICMTVVCFLSSGANAANSSNALNAIVTSNATMVAQHVLSQTTGHTRKKARIAIIIDDIGNKRADADAFALSEKVTFSILPHTPFSTQFSEFSFHQGREVMLHMPMESLHGEALGEGAILASMYPDEVEMAMLRALESVPHAIGVNNHMGSKLTQITLQMNAVMEVLNNNRLYFIDSRTTKFSKAHQIAKQHGVYSATRHVFLDHFANEAFLEKQFSQMLRKARRNGSVIGIAHPYPVTIEFLKKKLKDLPGDIELISVSEYLNIQNETFMSAPRLAKENRLQQDNDSQTNAIAPE